MSDFLQNQSPDPESAELRTGGLSAGHPWFAVRVRSNYERTTSTILRSKGYEEFPALYPSKRRWSDRLKEVELPLFPGYVFCRFDSDRRLPILTTAGVVHIVGVGNTPEPVDGAEIAAIQAVVRSGLPAGPWPFLRVGERVRVECGSMKDVEGIVVSLKKQLRLVISVTLLQRSVAVEIERGWIRPV
jgi:transcription antitermination factor NusG